MFEPRVLALAKGGGTTRNRPKGSLLNRERQAR